jgi:hypothetical protein
MKYILFVASFLFLLASCDETENFVLDSKEAYFPLEIGKYITYSVDSIQYSTSSGGATNVVSSTFQWREMVVDTFRDAENRLVYEVERMQRTDANEDWRLVNVITVTKMADRVELVENNRRFVKMFLPLKLADTLHLFQYFNEFELVSIEGEVIEAFKGWEYLVQDLDVPSSVGSFSFDSTSTISYADSENAIEVRFVREQYAKNIGLIAKEYMILDTQCITGCIGMSWEEKAEQGFILRMTMIDHN